MLLDTWDMNRRNGRWPISGTSADKLVPGSLLYDGPYQGNCIGEQWVRFRVGVSHRWWKGWEGGGGGERDEAEK